MSASLGLALTAQKVLDFVTHRIVEADIQASLAEQAATGTGRPIVTEALRQIARDILTGTLSN